LSEKKKTHNTQTKQTTQYDTNKQMSIQSKIYVRHKISDTLASLNKLPTVLKTLLDTLKSEKKKSCYSDSFSSCNHSKIQ